MDTTHARKQIEEKLQILQTIQEELQTEDMERVISLFADIKKGNKKLGSYIEDTRDLLRQVAEHLNEKVKGLDIEFEHEARHMNSCSLDIVKGSYLIGELDLSNRHVDIRQNPFRFFMWLQKDLPFQVKSIEEGTADVTQQEKEWMKTKKRPVLVRRMRRISQKGEEKIEKYLADRKKRLEEERRKYEASLNAVPEKWDQAVKDMQNLKAFLSIMRENGFTHDAHLYAHDTKYTLYQNDIDNMHYSTTWSYEEGNLMFMHWKEWTEQDLLEQEGVSRKVYTDDEFHAIGEAIGKQDVCRLEKASEEEWVVSLVEGELFIQKNGIIYVKGEDCTLYHLLRIPDIREAVMLKNKRTYDSRK